MVRILEQLSGAAAGPAVAPGQVSLVGAGPGDPALLTRAALDRLARADLVLHDALLPPSLLAMVPPRARLVPVGKRAGRASHDQEEIHRQMVREARAGKRVVRLKGGDPFLFGRGGEEIEALESAGIWYEIIPGITAALGAAAAYAIPLTRRGAARSLRIVTGTTSDDGHEEPAPSSIRGFTTAFGSDQETLVVYMAGRRLDRVARELLTAGRSPDTPIAVIERATWSDGACHRMRLSELAAFSQSRRVRSPALLIAGPTAGAAEGVRRPTAAPRTVVVAGVLQEVARAAEPYRLAGCRVHELPLLRVVEGLAAPELRKRAARLAEYRALFFGDPHTVEPFLDALWADGSDLRALSNLRILAADAATADVLRGRGLRPDGIGPLKKAGSDDRRFRTAATTAERTLVLSGPDAAGEDHVAAYALDPMPPDPEAVRAEFAATPPDLWTLTSPAALAAFLTFLRALGIGAPRPHDVSPRPDPTRPLVFSRKELS